MYTVQYSGYCELQVIKNTGIMVNCLPRFERCLVEFSKYPLVIPLYKATDHRVAEVSNLKSICNYYIREGFIDANNLF
jgi:hypothetical protein